MKKILIQLVGEPIDLDDLKYGLKTTEWAILKESGDYFLTSPVIDKLKDRNEVKSKVLQFLDILNGAANLFHGNHKKIDIGSIVEIDEAGQRTIIVALKGEVTIRTRVRGTLTINGDTKLYSTTIEQWIEKANKYNSVREVLHFSNEITWWNLYKIFEIIRDDLGGQKHLYNFISREKLTHFTQTAQSMEMLGDHARHASKMKYPAPKKILTLAEANQIIKTLFENWINVKN